jgi:hypothetical protein
MTNKTIKTKPFSMAIWLLGAVTNAQVVLTHSGWQAVLSVVFFILTAGWFFESLFQSLTVVAHGTWKVKR